MYNNNGIWSTEGCFLSHFVTGRAECECNHLTEFSLRRAKDESDVDNNADATTDLDSVKDYDLTTNFTPLVVICSILLIFFPVFIILRKSEKRVFSKSSLSGTAIFPSDSSGTAQDQTRSIVVECSAQQGTEDPTSPNKV